MAVSTSVTSTHHRRRRRRLKSDESSDNRSRKLTAGILGILMVVLLASLGVIAANIGK